MDSDTRAREQWVVQPLVDAGLPLEEIRELLFRLAFEDIVSEGRDTLACAAGLAAGRTVEVQQAWSRTIARMPALGLPA
ncbi:hypothetical protein [Modestobacter versicolor]|uniref:hypothetical protein n=1 Tax=Modestobacter versicolor TaxID=429133 RepID=UPI0034E04BA8